MKQIEVTRGTNGYPSGLYKAELFESVKEMQDAINQGESDFGIFRKKDGWQLWEYAGFVLKPFNMQEQLAEDKNILVIEKEYNIVDIKIALEDEYPECENDDKDYKAERKEWINNLALVIHTEMNLYIEKYHTAYEVFEVSYGEEKPLDMWEKETVTYTDDVWTYSIGK